MASHWEREFETRYKQLLRNGPTYVREYRFDTKRRFRFDFAFPTHRVAVEIDGGTRLPNGGRHAKDSDREKLNLATIGGWKVLRFSGEQLKNDPILVMGQIQQLLAITERENRN